MSYNYNNYRHNSIGGNWQLPPPSGYADANPEMAQGQAPGFRNPWFSQQSPQQSPSSGQHVSSSVMGSPNLSQSPTKSAIPLLQHQASAKRLSFVNQLPTTYEYDQGSRHGSVSLPGGQAPPFIHPPIRAGNPFNQYYTNPEVQLHQDRRMSAAAIPDHMAYQAQYPAGYTANAPTQFVPQQQMNRRSSIAVGGYVQDRRFPSPGYQSPGSPGGRRPYQSYQQSQLAKHQSRVPRAAPRAQKVYSKLNLKPQIHPQPKYRRASATGNYISPVNALSVYLTESFSICQPRKFQYNKMTNPKRVLTKPSESKYNNGYDNEDSDYILYVNDILGTEEGRKYMVLDLLGSGTFGQVVKCQNLANQSMVAVKVIKSKSAYMNQSLTEVKLLEFLNVHSDGKYFIRLLDTFMHKEHLCLVFEQLASNLYELIKQNQFQGLNMKLVKLLTRQLLEAMAQLKGFQMIHCDLKPENILLCQPDKPDIKVIDFGSACYTRQTVYTYIQSRFYRSPEVILGLHYTEAIDMWSLGCIVGELFLGLPMFPGTSEYNQIWKIVDMLGAPPRHMIEVGRNSMNFFRKSTSQLTPEGKPVYKIKSYDEYLEFLAHSKGKEDSLKKEQPNKNYFEHRSLSDIILNYKMPSKKMTNSMIEKECHERMLLIDFLTKVLNLNPVERLTPQEALKHPFVNEAARDQS
ncbi:dual specificity protein kinase Yak1p [Diutina catenulata]